MREAWASASLGDVCRVAVDRRDAAALGDAVFIGLEHMDSQSPRIVRHGTTAGVVSQVVEFKPNDTLFGRLRPYLRKVALADFGGYCSPEILVLRPETAAVLPGFLQMLASSNSAIEWAISVSAGSRMPRTSASDLLALEVAIPPLDEQRRIVDLIDALLEFARSASATAERATHARSSILAELLEGQREVPATYDRFLDDVS